MSDVRSSQYAEVAPIAQARAARTKLSFRITVEGIMLLIVILLVGFAAWHSGTNLLYLIFSILVAFYLVHGFVLSLNIHWLDFSVDIPETVVAKQPFDITAVVLNRKRFVPAYALRLMFQHDQRQALPVSMFFPVIPRAGSRGGLCTTQFLRRGMHTFTTVSISTRYPFGFEERTKTRKVHKQIMALPPTYNVAAIASNIPFGFGDQESTVRGAGTDLYGLREYIPGEPARHVHWRTSARLQKLMVSEYIRDERRQVILLLDNGITPECHSELHDDFENAIVLTASLARHLIDTGFEVGLVTADATLPVRQGTVHLLAIMRHLTLLQLSPPRPLLKSRETVLQIFFHSDATELEPGTGGLSIDSRSWIPRPDQLIVGEKL